MPFLPLPGKMGAFLPSRASSGKVLSSFGIARLPSLFPFSTVFLVTDPLPLLLVYFPSPLREMKTLVLDRREACLFS